MTTRNRAFSALLAVLSLSALPACDEEDRSFRTYSGSSEALTFFAADGTYMMRFETPSNTCGDTLPSATRQVEVLGGSMEDGRPFLNVWSAPVMDLGLPGVEDVGATEPGFSIFISRTVDTLTNSGLGASQQYSIITVTTALEGSATRIVLQQTTTIADPGVLNCVIERRITLTRDIGQAGAV